MNCRITKPYNIVQCGSEIYRNQFETDEKKKACLVLLYNLPVSFYQDFYIEVNNLKIQVTYTMFTS